MFKCKTYRLAFFALSFLMALVGGCKTVAIQENLDVEQIAMSHGLPARVNVRATGHEITPPAVGTAVIANTPDAESYPGQPGKKAPSDSELISPDEVFRSQEQPSRSLWVDFTLEAGANLVGALVGALLAIPTGLWIDRKRSAKEQRDRALVVLRALEDELAKNTQSITDYLAKPAKREQISYPSISNDAWQAAHELGLLVGLNNYDLYKSLIEVYEQLELISHLSKSLWQLFFTPAADFSFIDTRVQLLQESLRTESESAATLIRRTRNEISQALAP